MILRALAVAVASIALGAAAWVLTPPFPEPRHLIDMPIASLSNHFGPPIELTPERIDPRFATSLLWERPRGVARWTLRADWYAGPEGPMPNPDSVTRCLHLNWGPDWLGVVLFLPCTTLARAQVATSNMRWSGRAVNKVPGVLLRRAAQLGR